MIVRMDTSWSTHKIVMLNHIGRKKIGSDIQRSANDLGLALFKLLDGVVKVHFHVQPILKDDVCWLREPTHVG